MGEMSKTSRGGMLRIGSDGPYEERFGYSRAVAAGPYVHVAGCTALIDGMIHHEGDPYHQAVTAFRFAEKALGEAGLSLQDAVRTRMYIVHARDAGEVGRAHADLFGDVRPAATMLIVSGLVDSGMLVEIEVDAYRGERG